MTNAKRFPSDYKVGVLGGGQLGKMLALAAANWGLPFYVLDESADFPAAPYCTRFTEGSFQNYQEVYQFGKTMDVVTIEIEHVNTEALLQLQKEGVTVHPSPQALTIIKDKGLQKQFYAENGLATAPFTLYESEAEVLSAITAGKIVYPFVQKSRTAGYDGKGVAVIKNESDHNKILPGACVIEPLVDIDKEIAVIVARNASGEVAAYPAVEMEFNPEANLVEFLFCPAAISLEVAQRAEDLAKATIAAFDMCGLLAVELFLTQSGDLLINEVAPRTHNSGHHTIDSCVTSQFEMQLLAILNLPLGSTKMHSPSVMVNLLGEPGYSGPAVYEGMADCLRIPGAKFHLYGKSTTKPFRKMGHATVMDADLEVAKKNAVRLKDALRIIA
jgi:5-(carboxyamino)imidazole ribonucleotide synthase